MQYQVIIFKSLIQVVCVLNTEATLTALLNKLASNPMFLGELATYK